MSIPREKKTDARIREVLRTIAALAPTAPDRLAAFRRRFADRLIRLAVCVDPDRYVRTRWATLILPGTKAPRRTSRRSGHRGTR